MKRSLTLLSAFAFAVALAGPKLSISDVVKSPDKFDKKVITLSGVVDKFQAKTSRIGNKYFVFELKSGKDFVNVYGRGELAKPLSNGQRAEVKGPFEKEHKMKDFSVKNQIEAKDPKDVKLLLK